jgi:hypothetical protein
MAQPAPSPEGTPAANEITINSDGSYSPAGGVQINAGGVAKFTVNYRGEQYLLHSLWTNHLFCPQERRDRRQHR